MSEPVAPLAVLAKLLFDTVLKPKVCCVQCRSIVVLGEEDALERHSCDDPTLLDLLRAQRMRNGETLQ